MQMGRGGLNIELRYSAVAEEGEFEKEVGEARST